LKTPTPAPSLTATPFFGWIRGKAPVPRKKMKAGEEKEMYSWPRWAGKGIRVRGNGNWYWYR